MAEKIEKDKENNNNQDVINLSEIIFTLAKHIKLILFIPTIFRLLTILNVQFLVKPVFVSQAKIMSSSQTQSSQAAGIAARFGISIPEISGDVEWVYPEIVKSRKISKLMLKRKFDTNEFGPQKLLLQILTYGYKKPAVGLDTLIKSGVHKMQSMIEIDKSGNFYDLSIKAGEPEFARDLVDALIEELDTHQKNYNRSKTSKTRLFIEERIVDTHKDLEKAEEKLKNFRDRNRRIENSPSLQLEETRLLRETAVLTGVYTTLKQQLETTKIEEVKDSDYVIVLDRPEAPLERTSPRKKRSVIIAGFFGIFLGIFLAIIKGYFDNIYKKEKKIFDKIKKMLVRNILDFIPNFFKK